MAREPIQTWYFALVVVRLGHRFLMMQERKYGSAWSIPGGRVEPGEHLARAAVREVHEETGVPVRLDGILRVEHSPMAESTARMRVIYVGTPIDDTSPKTTADEESRGAAWMTLAEIRELTLRGTELLDLLEGVADGAPIYPLELFGTELSV
ncbi:MAG TPA: NUDIX hydrolase [Kofleriaceae bacterium]|jgi:phosphatase NudJ